jgi:uncharacterized membrane protein
MARIFKYSFWLAIVFFSYLLLLISLQYIPIKLDVAFLATKTSIIHLRHYQLAFFTHVFTAIFTTFFAIPLFSNTIRKKYVVVHRLLGNFYVVTVLLFAAPSGFIMSFYANGGLAAQTSFILLSVLWWIFTFKAYTHIRNKNIKKHQQFMLRSYALTLSAISLRLFKWIIANTLVLPPMDTYVIVAWLSWTVNLCIAETMIFRIKNRY